MRKSPPLELIHIKSVDVAEPEYIDFPWEYILGAIFVLSLKVR